MPLSVGTKLGPYEILAPLGAGGMGAVWKARDTRLHRDVAIKISHAKFSERFDREARAIAALNDPHICQIYDVGPDYLVMELVDGVPLKGPLPLGRALPLAIQLAGALDAAHRQGISHRDLKPANILVTKSGIKLLDFGLAKIDAPKTEPPHPPQQTAEDPTASLTLTQPGMIIGTLQYMSPEQLQGKDADARSDIFAFGCVLYEMLTAKRAFDGATAASVVGAILEREAPSLGSIAPAALDRILRTCLAKDPDDRWQTARDLKRELEWIVSAEETDACPPANSRITWVMASVAGLCLVAAASTTFLWLRQPAAPVRAARFHVEPPADRQFSDLFSSTAISPDGRFLVFGATTGSAGSALRLRPMDSFDTKPLGGTEGADLPFWSPDSKSLAFFAGGKLKRIEIAGGPAVEVCACDGAGGSWSTDRVILFGGPDGLRRVSASGGAPTKVTDIDAARREAGHFFPQFLPGGKHFLYLIVSADPGTWGVYTGSLDHPRERNRLLVTNTKAIYTASPDGGSGSLLWLRERALMKQAFDAGRLRLQGDAVLVADSVATSFDDASRISMRAAFWASDAGVLAYHGDAVSDKSRLVWKSREGKPLEEVGPEDRYGLMALSPDGKRLAIGRTDAMDNRDIWLCELSRRVMTRFTFDPGDDYAPIWSPDGRHIAFSSNRSGVDQIYRKSVDGQGRDEQLTSFSGTTYATDWSPDGQFLLYNQRLPTKPDFSLWALPLFGDRKPVGFRNSWAEGEGVFSPDGKMLAYISNSSGQLEIYIRSFSIANTAAEGRIWQVSNHGGVVPLWRGDGKELFYAVPGGNHNPSSTALRGGTTKFMVAGIRTGSGGMEIETPRELFSAPAFDTTRRSWAVTPDGQRFLIEEAAAQPGIRQLTVVLNWQAGLKK